MYIYVSHMWLVPRKARMGYLDPLELELHEVVSYLMWVQGIELGFLQEQWLLLTPGPMSLVPNSCF